LPASARSKCRRRSPAASHFGEPCTSASAGWATALNPETQARLLGSVHERIPMVTPDEQRTLQRENLETDEKFWTDLHDLHDLHAGTVEDKKGLAAKVGHEIAEGQAELAKTAAQRDTAKAKRERLDRGAEGTSG
jgi:hypothetical protein